MKEHRRKVLLGPQNWAGWLHLLDGAAKVCQKVFATALKSKENLFNFRKAPGFLVRFQLVALDL